MHTDKPQLMNVPSASRTLLSARLTSTLTLLGVLLTESHSNGQIITYQDLHPDWAASSALSCVSERQEAGQITIEDSLSSDPSADPSLIEANEVMDSHSDTSGVIPQGMNVSSPNPIPITPPPLLPPPDLNRMPQPLPSFRAALWAGSADSVTLLSEKSSRVHDMTDTHQVGESGNQAVVWAGTPDSETPLMRGPISIAYGIDEDWKVGMVTLLDFEASGSHAVLWEGPQQRMLDLHPGGALRSVAYDTYAGQQAGWVDWGSGPNATIWLGNPSRSVNLHPGQHCSASMAYATTLEIQAGSVWMEGRQQAAIWRGTAASVRSLHPIGADSSAINDAMGEWQVGYAMFGENSQAMLWAGSASSALSLHTPLLADGYVRSTAAGVWTDGHLLRIAGSALAPDGHAHAILWTVVLPDEEPPVIVDASASQSVLWPPNNRMLSVSLHATVRDNSGEVVWGVVGIDCNEAGSEQDMKVLDDHTVSLRASRSGWGEGRIYTIWLQAIDGADNLSEPVAVEVIVPHERAGW